MAILPHKTAPGPKQHSVPTANIPTNAGPKRLTIEEYHRRQAIIQEERLTKIPPTQKPKHRRAGRKVRLRRRLAALLNILKSPNPPPYNDPATEAMWQEVATLRTQLNTTEQHNNINETNM